MDPFGSPSRQNHQLARMNNAIVIIVFFMLATRKGKIKKRKRKRKKEKRKIALPNFQKYFFKDK